MSPRGREGFSFSFGGTMFKTTCCLLILCALGVRADRGTDSKSKAAENAKVTPQNISALYIGDLLRTKPREDLEEAGSVQQPIRVTHHHTRPNPHRSLDHGGQAYPESYQYSQQGSKSYVPVDAKTSVPVVGRFLSLRPVRYVHKEDSRTPYRKAVHHEGDDCPKGEDHSHEGRQYSPEDRQYRREKQVVDSASTEGGYEEDDRSAEYTSYAEPHRSTYVSRTHPTNTKSESKSGSSYSQSKSTSTSKTMTPKRVKQSFTIVPKRFQEDNFEKPTTEPATEGRDLLMYKTKDPRDRPSQNQGSYRPKEYGPDYENGERTEDATPYSQYPPGMSGHRKGYTRGQTPYSNGAAKEQERPRQYRPYDREGGSYEQSTYAPAGQHRPTESHHLGRDYNTPPTLQKPAQYGVSEYQNHQDPESDHRYEPQRPLKSKQYSTSGGGDERVGYNKEVAHKSTPPSRPYSYPNEPYSQVPEKPPSYQNYNPRATSPSYAAPSHHGGHQIVSPHEEDDTLLNTAHHRGSKPRHLKSHRKQYHEPRYARSSGQYLRKPAGSAEESSVLPVNSPAMLHGRDGKPYVSHSVSYSNSGGEAYDVPQTKPGSQGVAEGRHGMPLHAEKPITYKPYNSEYPASYANDPLHRSGARQNRHYSGGPRSYERPDSYEDHPDEDHRPYDEGSSDSYEQQDAEGGSEPKDKTGHHYVSNIEGYRDEYHSDVPLHLDDAFFKKYGISKKAKIIVASAVDPHMLVADGSKVPEGGYKDEEGGAYDDGYTLSEEEDDRRYASSVGDQEQGPHYHQQQPDYQQEQPDHHQHQQYNDDSEDSNAPEEHGGFGPKDLPGSFDDLVDTNTKFLRNLPSIMNPGDSAFKSDANFDENDFHNVAHKGFVVSQGPREIVQQHGDGVSRILFNVPKKEDDPFKMAEDEALLSAASALLEDVLKSDS